MLGEREVRNGKCRKVEIGAETASGECQLTLNNIILIISALALGYSLFSEAYF